EDRLLRQEVPEPAERGDARLRQGRCLPSDQEEITSQRLARERDLAAVLEALRASLLEQSGEQDVPGGPRGAHGGRVARKRRGGQLSRDVDRAIHLPHSAPGPHALAPSPHALRATARRRRGGSIVEQTWDPERYARNARFVAELGAPVV